MLSTSLFALFFGLSTILIVDSQHPTEEETERALVVKPQLWWSSVIKKENEIRAVAIGGSNTYR